MVRADEPGLTITVVATDAKGNFSEQAVTLAINDLVEDGYVSKTKDGRNNHYEINKKAPLRHSTSQGKTVGQLIAALGELG